MAKIVLEMKENSVPGNKMILVKWELKEIMDSSKIYQKKSIHLNLQVPLSYGAFPVNKYSAGYLPTFHIY
jgi:hypothetical protein